jgi:hypothetical protein
MIEKGFQLNLITPSILTNQFLHKTQHKKRTVVAITIGASKNAYDGSIRGSNVFSSFFP